MCPAHHGSFPSSWRIPDGRAQEALHGVSSCRCVVGKGSVRLDGAVMGMLHGGKRGLEAFKQSGDPLLFLFGLSPALLIALRGPGRRREFVRKFPQAILYKGFRIGKDAAHALSSFLGASFSLGPVQRVSALTKDGTRGGTAPTGQNQPE